MIVLKPRAVALYISLVAYNCLSVVHCAIFRSILNELVRLLHCTEQAKEDQDIVDAELVRVKLFALHLLEQHALVSLSAQLWRWLPLLSQVHTAGFVSDLPVHVSSLEEVRSMCGELKDVLHSLHKPPTLVTIARYVAHTIAYLLHVAHQFIAYIHV